jgi:hypothetical protein
VILLPIIGADRFPPNAALTSVLEIPAKPGVSIPAPLFWLLFGWNPTRQLILLL